MSLIEFSTVICELHLHYLSFHINYIIIYIDQDNFNLSLSLTKLQAHFLLPTSFLPVLQNPDNLTTEVSPLPFLRAFTIENSSWWIFSLFLWDLNIFRSFLLVLQPRTAFFFPGPGSQPFKMLSSKEKVPLFPSFCERAGAWLALLRAVKLFLIYKYSWYIFGAQ